LFSEETASTITKVKKDVGDVFYVEFSSEDACLKGFQHIRTKVLDGKRVGVRVKSENLLKNL